MHFLPAPDESLWAGVLRLELTIPGARSLKDRRRAVAHVRDRIRARGGLSVAEVGHLESHSRAVVAVGMVSSDQRLIHSTLDALSHEVEQWGRVRVDSRALSVLRPFAGPSGGDEGPGDDGEDWDAPWALP